MKPIPLITPPSRPPRCFFHEPPERTKFSTAKKIRSANHFPIAILLLLLAISRGIKAQDTPASHTWISKDGKSLQARFVRVGGEAVIVLKDGKEVTIPFDRLASVSVEQAKKLGGVSHNAPIVATPGKSSSEISTKAEIHGKRVDVVVRYLPGSDKQARQQLDWMLIYLPILAEYTGVVPDRDKYVVQQTIEDNPHNDGTIIYIPFFKSLVPWLIYHEMAHWWLGSSGPDTQWFDEGAVSFLPYAIAGENALPSYGEDERKSHLDWWWFYDPHLDPDVPLEGGYATVVGKIIAPTYVYTKSFKIQYLLYQELGREKYRELIRTLAARRKSGFSTVIVLNELTKLKPINWREFLTGWVFSGTYQKYSLQDFRDRDHDGLLDIQEKYMGTNPDLADTDSDGISDGMELTLGFSPLEPEAKDKIRDKVKSVGPLIDGLSQEWEWIPEAKSAQSKGNPNAAGSIDLMELSYVIQRETLFVMLKTREPIKTIGDNQYFGLVVQNGDNDTKKMNHFFAFWIDRPGITWQQDDGHETVYPSGLKAGSAQVIEMAIPLSLFEAKSVKIFPMIKDRPSGKKLSEWPQWVIVR